MAFCWSTIQVSNMNQSVKFYEDAVGLRVIRRYEPAAGIEITFMGYGKKSDETQVELICRENSEIPAATDSITLGFTVDSLRGHLDFLKTLNVLPISEVVQPNPSIKFTFVHDPDGVRIQFVEFLDPNAVKDI